MKISSVSALSAVLVPALFLAGCVTINIYFPASAAEKAADKIIDEIWQSQGEAKAPAVTPPVNDKPEKP